MTSSKKDVATSPASDAACVTVLTHSGFIGKRFDRGPDGLAKTSKATFYDGTARTELAQDAETLAQLLDSLQPRDVLSLGRMRDRDHARVTTADKLAQNAGAIARNLDFFAYPQGQGWLLLDHDTKSMPADVAQRVAELGDGVAAIESIWPELAQAERVYRPSSSGGVYIEGQDPTEATGFHLFVLLQDVTQSKAVLDALMARAWEAGLAWHSPNAAGQLLERAIIDASVGSPERLVFTAAPQLGAGVYRKAPEMRIQRGVALAAPTMPERQGWLPLVQESRRKIQPEAKAAEAAFLDRQADKIAAQSGISKDTARKIARERVVGRILEDDDLLELKDGTTAQVADILDQHFPHAGVPKFSLPDPVEGAEYGKTTAAIMWGSGFDAPVLVSQAHGRQTVYRFARHMSEDDRAAHDARRAHERAVEAGELPEVAELPNGRDTTLREALRAAETREQALSVALAVISKRIRRTPHNMSAEDLLAFITGELRSGVLPEADVEFLRRKIAARNFMRRKAALGFSDISPETRRMLYRDHDVTTVDSLSDVAVMPHGVVMVKAPMGSGKTQRVGRPWVDAARKWGSVMAICHRVSLVDELAARLDLPHYQRAAPEDVMLASGLAVCLPSITGKLATEAMPQPDFVFIDEAAQVLQFLESKDCCGTRTADTQGVYDKLVAIIRGARAVLVADAGLDDRVIEFLRHCRPRERLRLIKMDAQPRAKDARVYAAAGVNAEKAKSAVLAEILLELANGGKTFIACDSAKLVLDVAKVLEQHGHSVLPVTASTKDGKAQRAFLRDADGASRLYDALVVSPAVVSGISIEHQDSPHFTLGAFIGAGQTIVPSDAAQQIARVRYLTRYVIGLGTNNRAGRQSGEAILAGDVELAEIENAPVVVDHFDQMRADIKAKAENAKADFAAGLFWMLEADGWKLDVVAETSDRAGADALKAAREEQTAEWHAAIIAAEIPDDETAAFLRGRRLEMSDLARLEAYDIAQCLGLAKIDQAAIERWDEGRIAGKLRRFRALTGPEIATDGQAVSQRIIARDFGLARQRLLKWLFAGIDLRAEYPFDPETQEKFTDRIMERRLALTAAGILPSKYAADGMTRPKQFKRVLDDAVSRLGLRVAEARTRVCQNTPSLYSNIQGEGISAQPQQVRIFGICPASWAEMEELVHPKPEAPSMPIKPISSDPVADLAAERRKRMASATVMAKHMRIARAGLIPGQRMASIALAFQELEQPTLTSISAATGIEPTATRNALVGLNVIGLVGRDPTGKAVLEGPLQPRKLIWAEPIQSAAMGRWMGSTGRVAVC